MANVTESTIDRFRPQRVNRNRHKERGMGALEVSMRKLGYVAPMTAAASGEIIDGSARLETSAIVFDDDVLVVEHDGQRPIVMVRTDIPSADAPEARQIAIAANRIASLNLDWDVEGLLEDAASGLDLSGLFAQSELDEMLAELTPPNVGADTEAKIDKAEELRQQYGVELGQMWQLGEHRIVCGDCTDRAVVERVMGGKKTNMLLSSPPYNSMMGGIKSDYYGKQERFYQDRKIDKKTKDEWLTFCDNVLRLFVDFSLNDACPAVWNVMYNANMRDGYGLSMFAGDHGMTVKETICWYKGRGFNIATKGILSRNWELVFVLSSGDKYFTTQDENETRYNFWEIGTDNTQIEGVHNAAFPLPFAEKAIEWFSNDNHVIYEPFAGSGTALIACENLRRRCRAIEISPAYVAVCLDRWATHTGQQPVLLES